MATINPYIGFAGQCAEAMTFYKECIGGELDLQRVAGSPMEQYWPNGGDKVFHSALVSGGITIMGSDMTGPGGHVIGNNMAIAIGCTSEEEINTFFNKLGEGGKVLDPLDKKFWGAIFGTIEDKFGIRWMFNYDAPQQ
jgi:PhnB protein